MRTQVDVLASYICGRLVWRLHVLSARWHLLQCTDGKRRPLRNGTRQAAVALGSLPSASLGAYFFGSFLSEWMGKTIKHMHFLRWDTLLIALEMCVLLSFLPSCRLRGLTRSAR